MSKDAPWRDEELLRQKYVVEGHSTPELAEKWSCSKSVVWRWVDKFGLNHEPEPKLAVYNTGSEREFIQYRNHYVYHHRLLATLLVDDVSDLDGMHVHHEWEGGKLPGWVNFLDALEVISPEEHGRLHYEAGDHGLTPGPPGT